MVRMKVRVEELDRNDSYQLGIFSNTIPRYQSPPPLKEVSVLILFLTDS